MDLPNLFSSGKENTELKVLFVLLSDVKLQAFLLEISENGIDVLSESKISEYESLDSCVIKADECLQQLGAQSEDVNSVIFGIDQSWMEKSDVSDGKKPFLKKITDELSLEPLGFVVVSEAIIQQELSKNSLFSGIVCVLSKTHIVLSFVAQGELKASETVGRSNDILGDYMEGLARLATNKKSGDVYMPNRIILASIDLDETELEEQQQLLYDIDWQAQSGFLQTPIVQIISKSEFVAVITQEAGKAVAIGKGMTKAAMVASMPKTDKSKTVKTTETRYDNIEPAELGFAEVTEFDEENDGESLAKNSEQSNNTDQANNKDQIINQKNSEGEYKTAEPIVSSFGVPISVSKTATLSQNIKDDLDSSMSDNLNQGTDDEKDKKKSPHHKHLKKFIFLSFISGIGALLILAFVFANFFASLNLKLTPKKQVISKDITVTVDHLASGNEAEDAQAAVIKATKISKTSSTTSTMQTTGIKIVGEKAKGKVTIFNQTDATKTLAKGTVLKSGELEYELTADVTVASASTNYSSATKEFGKTDANIEAKAIGVEYNLEKDKELAIIPFDKSSYYAKVSSDGLAGGSSREVKVIAEADMEELLADTRKELLNDINETLKNEAIEGQYILPSNVISSEKAKYNGEVEAEISELQIELEITVDALAYQAEDLKPLAKSVLSSELQSGYILSDADPQILSESLNLDDKKIEKELKSVTFEASISSISIPDFNKEKIFALIQGKNISEIESILKNQAEAQKVEYQIIPNLLKPFTLKVPSNINKFELDYNLDK